MVSETDNVFRGAPRAAIIRAMTVDEFIAQKVRPEHRDIVAALRALMRETAPAAREVVTYGILGWRVRRVIAVVSPTRQDVTFSFAHGAGFRDRYGLLRDYIRQAVALETA